MSLKLVVFDFDGTLVESTMVKHEAFVELYRVYGEAVAARVQVDDRQLMGVNRQEKFLRWHQLFLNQALDRAGLDELSRRFSVLVVEKVVASPFVDGAAEFLSRAQKAGLKLWIASATPVEELRVIVARRGMSAFFERVEGFPLGKDAVLREGIARFGVGSVVMVGDTTEDLRAAQAAGTPCWLRDIPGNKGLSPHSFRTFKDLEPMLKGGSA